MNRESYLLRQRQKQAKRGEEAAESVNHMDSNEQEVVIESLATEANNQATFFTVRVMVRVAHQQVKLRSTERWRYEEHVCFLLFVRACVIAPHLSWKQTSRCDARGCMAAPQSYVCVKFERERPAVRLRCHFLYMQKVNFSQLLLFHFSWLPEPISTRFPPQKN